MTYKVKYFSLFFFIFFSILQGNSQIGAHYWSNQYGSKGLLMNGAVIASPEDETSIFYNPGAMGLDEQLGFAFSFITPTYSDLQIRNLIGDNNRLRNRDFNFSPVFLAARFRPFDNKNFVVGVATFKRYKTDYSYRDQVIQPIQSIENLTLRADLDYLNKISEDWLGIGISYNLSQSIAIGLTQFGIVHSQNVQQALTKEITNQTNIAEASQSWRAVFDYRLSLYGGNLTKVGLAYKGENIKAGLTYTSPVYGQVTSNASYAYDDQRTERNDLLISSLAFRENTELLNFKTATGVGFGIEWSTKKYSGAFSAEYFSAVDEYVYFDIKGTPFTDNINQSNRTSQLSTAKSSISNIAFAFEYDYSKRTTYITGFRTDLNQEEYIALNGSVQQLSLTPDIYHLSFGALHSGRKNSFAVGLDIAYGRTAQGNQLVDFNNVTRENIYSFSGKDNVSSQYTSIMLFFTYDFLSGNLQEE